MPRGDRTGPEGMGRMTGRSMGFCAGYPNPGYLNNMTGGAFGRRGGRGFGRGLGFGFRERREFGDYDPYYENRQYSHPSKDEELHMLKTRAENINKSLEEIQKRILELENTKT